MLSRAASTTALVASSGDGRVLDASERPIPGLFAAGCLKGGLEGGRTPQAGSVIRVNSRRCWMSRTGGSPKWRLYSRLKCEASS
jgi:hypothetical protein